MMVFQEFRGPLIPGWRQTGKTGGIMLEKNSHFFDLFNWFAESEPVRVTGMGGNNVNHDSPLIDHCIVTVEYRNNIRATLLMCLFSEHGSQPTLDIVGDKGVAPAFKAWWQAAVDPADPGAALRKALLAGNDDSRLPGCRRSRQLRHRPQLS